jgi:hypothetical protein
MAQVELMVVRANLLLDTTTGSFMVGAAFSAVSVVGIVCYSTWVKCLLQAPDPSPRGHPACSTCASAGGKGQGSHEK